MHECAICRHLGLQPRATDRVVGLATEFEDLVAVAYDHLDEDVAEGRHVMVPACPEHVVEIYRGRLAGIRMAWRLPVGPLLPAKG